MYILIGFIVGSYILHTDWLSARMREDGLARGIGAAFQAFSVMVCVWLATVLCLGHIHYWEGWKLFLFFGLYTLHLAFDVSRKWMRFVGQFEDIQYDAPGVYAFVVKVMDTCFGLLLLFLLSCVRVDSVKFVHAATESEVVMSDEINVEPIPAPKDLPFDEFLRKAQEENRKVIEKVRLSEMCLLGPPEEFQEDSGGSGGEGESRPQESFEEALCKFLNESSIVHFRFATGSGVGSALMFDKESGFSIEAVGPGWLHEKKSGSFLNLAHVYWITRE